MPSGGQRKGAGRKPGPKKRQSNIRLLVTTHDKLAEIGNGSVSAGIEKLVSEHNDK